VSRPGTRLTPHPCSLSFIHLWPCPVRHAQCRTTMGCCQQGLNYPSPLSTFSPQATGHIEPATAFAAAHLFG
jgi:hypothetical protein